MYKLNHFFVTLIFLIVYFISMLLGALFFGSNLLGVIIPNFFVIFICLLHNKFSNHEFYHVVTLFELFTGLFVLTCLWFVVTLTGSFIQVNIPSSSEVIVDTTGFYVIFAIFIAPVTEELLFRGVIFRHLRDGYSLIVAYVISTLLFAIMHGTYYQAYAGLFCGTFFSFIYDYTGKLKWNILAHMVYNIMAFLSVYISVPNVFFELWFIIPLNILVVCLFFGFIIRASLKKYKSNLYIEHTFFEYTKDLKLNITNRISLLFISFKKFFISLISPSVSFIIKSFDDNIHISLYNQSGSCVYSGYIRDLYSDNYLLSLYVIPLSGGHGLQYYDNILVKHISFVVR